MERITEDKRYETAALPGRIEVFRPQAGDVFFVALKDLGMGSVWIGKKLCSMALARLRGHDVDAICLMLFSPSAWCRVLDHVTKMDIWNRDTICLNAKKGMPRRRGVKREDTWERRLDFELVMNPGDEIYQPYLDATRDFVRQRVTAAKVAQVLKQAGRPAKLEL